MATEGKPGFTVKDRRSFTEAGDSRTEGDGGAETAAVPSLDGGETGAGEDPATGLPAVDFHTFVLSLGSSALLHLGELEHPEGGDPRTDLGLAKHTIDIIAMLQAKTKGNLTPAEDKLIESLLYDLRLRYVEKSQGR